MIQWSTTRWTRVDGVIITVKHDEQARGSIIFHGDELDKAKKFEDFIDMLNTPAESSPLTVTR